MANKYKATRRFADAWAPVLVVGRLVLLPSLLVAAPVAVPAPVRKLVFESGSFTEPATVLLPCPDDPVWKRDILEKARRAGGLRAYIKALRSNPATSVWRACPERVATTESNLPGTLGFLVKNGLATVEEYRDGEYACDFLAYTDKISPLIPSGALDLPGCEKAFPPPSMALARRHLKSVDYTNQYVAQFGIPVKFFALRFTYTLEPTIAGLPKRSGSGKAVAHLDPNDGEWKESEVELSDSGYDLKQLYPTYEKVQLAVATGGDTGREASARGAGSAPAEMGCGDYASCLSAGQKAFKARDWAAATTAFRGATVADAAKKDGWEDLALALLASGQPREEVSKPWDTLLQSGRVVFLPACRKKLFSCEVGVLSLSRAKVTFAATSGKEAFSVPLSDVTPGELKKGSVSGTTFTSFRLGISGTDHWFEFIPPSGENCVHRANYFCKGDASSQQAIVGDYVLASAKSLGEGNRR